MSKHSELIALCDAGLNYLTQERQMYLARLEHYPADLHGVEALKGALQALKGALQAIEGCIDRLNYKRSEIVEAKRKYDENSKVWWPGLSNQDRL